jgi:hypothetical protein
MKRTGGPLFFETPGAKYDIVSLEGLFVQIVATISGVC